MSHSIGAFVGNVDPAVRRLGLELTRNIHDLSERLTTAETDIATLEADKAVVESGTYTPTLTGMAVGTVGAINTADYVYSGGPNLGDKGVLSIIGEIVFGSSGPTFPTAPTLTLPSGFEAVVSLATAVGLARLIDTGTASYQAWVKIASASTVTPTVWNVAGTYPTDANITTTVPFTWVATDQIRWAVNLPVVRV